MQTEQKANHKSVSGNHESVSEKRAHTVGNAFEKRAHTLSDDHENAFPKSVRIHYWPDGYWTKSEEEAVMADNFNVFGSTPHQVLTMPADADDESVSVQVKSVLEKRA